MKNVVEQILRHFAQKKWTLSVAESCTGGQLSGELAKTPGVSEIFMGGVVSYSNDVKKRLLNVKEESLKKNGAVSEVVAKEMAQGVKKSVQTDWALAVTGIAGPSGGTVEKPVGTVCFAVIGPEVEEVATRHFHGDREEIQTETVNCALSLVLNLSLNK